jgi:type IV pilus assembly protein PilQ
LADPQTVDLEFSNTNIQTVLNALAEVVGFNLVLGPEVSGNVDVRLHNVDWETALQTILSAHGFRYFWRDNVLVVMAEDGKSMEGLEHQIVKLHYADPTTVKAALTGILSPRGKIDLVGPEAIPENGSGPVQRPMLIVTELPHRMQTVLDLISSLDAPPPQFEISVKFVEADADEELGVGFNWPTKVSARISDARENPSTSSEEQTPASATYPIPDEKLWNFGTLEVGELSGFMEFLKQNGSARILSDPRVSVLENELATMQVVTTIPIETLSRFTEGAIVQDIVDFQELDVGITLAVRPRLNDDGEITLEVKPEVEEITGFTGPANNQRPITAKRGVNTTIRVKDGQTLVIGGLVRETEFSTKSRVFLLGDIPILGSLFTHNSTEKEKTDLLIFITPKIIAANG